MSRFHVGQRVVIVRGRGPAVPMSVGSVTVVASALHSVTWPDGGRSMAHDLEMTHEGMTVAAEPSWLAPLPDDSAEKGSWDALTLRCVRGVREGA